MNYFKGEQYMFCTKCGAENPEDAKFCFKCGNEMYGANDNSSDDKIVNDNAEEKEEVVNEKKENNSDTVQKPNSSLLKWLTSFEGVMSVKSFWFAQVALVLLGICVFFIDVSLLNVGAYNNTWLTWLYTIFYLFATISTEFRRLHDTNKSGAYILIGLIPIVGQIILLILLCLPRVEENNQWIKKQTEMLND